MKMLQWSLIGVMSTALIAGIVAQGSKKRMTSPSKRGSCIAETFTDVVHGTGIRSSHLVGMGVVNEHGDVLGTVNDLVLDTNTAKIRYVAMAHGGFLESEASYSHFHGNPSA